MTVLHGADAAPSTHQIGPPSGNRGSGRAGLPAAPPGPKRRRRFGRAASLATPILGWAIAAACTASLAAPLSRGGAIVGPPGDSAAEQPWLAGTIVEDVITPFSFTGWLTDSSEETVTYTGPVTGTVQSRVIHSVDDTYDFYWRISVDDDAFLPVLDFTLYGLPPSTFRAGWRADGPGTVRPAVISQSLSGTVRFAFGQYVPPSTQVRPGEQSRFLFVDSSSHGYTAGASFMLASGRDSGGSMYLQWGGESGRYPTFTPMPVPEPSSGGLSLAGLGLLAWWVRRARRH